MSALPDLKEYFSTLFQVARVMMPVLEEARRKPARPLNVLGAFTTFGDGLDLSDAALTQKGGYSVNETGYGVVFLRRGSHPGARLKLNIGGELRSFAPGDSLYGYFEELKLERGDNSATSGPYLLAIIRHPSARYVESPASVATLPPVTLLGTFGPTGVPTAYTTVAEDTDPSGAAPTGAFDVSGFSAIRVFVDTNSGGGNATSFDLVPWYNPSQTAAGWHEQGTERVAVPDTDTTGGQYRVVVFNVTGTGRMYLSIRNLLAAGRTGLGFAVQGIR